MQPDGTRLLIRGRQHWLAVAAPWDQTEEAQGVRVPADGGLRSLDEVVKVHVQLGAPAIDERLVADTAV